MDNYICIDVPDDAPMMKLLIFALEKHQEETMAILDGRNVDGLY